MTKTLADIGLIAIQLHAAQFETKEARHRYYARSRRYIRCFINNGKVGRNDPEFHRVTKVPYQAFTKARKHEYNVKRRLSTAIRAKVNAGHI